MNKKIKLAIITGLSGAGKTCTLSSFEENGFLIIENVPNSLIDNLFKEFKNNPNSYTKVALSVRLMNVSKVIELAKTYAEIDLCVVVLDCSKDVLLERYKLSRRIHPLQLEGKTLEESIDFEKENIRKLKEIADYYIDTSKFTPNDLKKYLIDNVFEDNDKKMSVNFVSFSYKKSVPQDVESVFDVRILPNPFWVKELKELTGLDKKIVDYILSFDVTHVYLKKLTDYLDFYLDEVKKTGRKLLTVGITCSGGQHRSVMVAEYLKKYYEKTYNTFSMHRDLKRK